ncbi:Flagellar hook-length control protein [Halomonas sp. THAF5a]|uniref:flagellar hook-length control protein FliK n=1 Tax=Halomonas sp. THAF5a TaxID=2587844 RepID=UPI0012A8C078|nr:flagellar hook-length control protein FliK [Halomonas sp. THAF5a]QFU00129.1 Flagellar hook-length control protein [Halomonas sp. THAF5a]
MDIQLLINAPGNAAGHRTAAGDAKAPDGAFARHLAGASYAHGSGAGKADGTSPRASSGQSDASLTSPAATRGQVEALKALLTKVPGETAPQTGSGRPEEHGPSIERLASLLGASTEEIEAALVALRQGDAPPDSRETTGQDALAATLQGFQRGERRSDDVEASGSGIWDAFQVRLALIERAGRPEADDALAVLPLAAAGPAGASTPGMVNPANPAAGDAVRLNPLLEAIAAERRGATASSPANTAALAAAAERLTPQGAGQAAASDETLRLAAAGDALPGQRGETPRTGAGQEPAGQGAANAMSGAMSAATGGTAGSPTGTAASPGQASLPAPVASPAWSQQLGQQLVRLSQHGGEQRVELKLHPAELGPLSVSLKMGDHGAQAQFVSAHAQVRQALEQAIPQLREALAEQGISLGETSVGEQRQGGTEGDDASGRPGGMLASAGSDAAEEGATVTLEEQGSRERVLDGRVDLYA